MAWSSSLFTQFPKSALGHGQTAAVLPAAYAGLTADTVKCALFNNTTNPDKNATLVTTGFNSSTSQWVVANEVTSSSDWPTGGIALGSKTLVAGTDTITFDAADTTHSNTVTLTNAYGCLVYDDTITVGTGGIADQGVSFHSFGGAQSVTTGTFTVVWHANGLFRITLS